MTKTRSYIDDKKIEQVQYLAKMGIERTKIAELTGISYKSACRIINGSRDKTLEYYRERNRQKMEAQQQTVQMTIAEQKADEATSAMSDKALYETLKNAVLDAMNEALARNMSNLRGMVLSAIRTANQ